MRIFLTSLLIIVVGISFSIGSGAAAQTAYPQYPAGPTQYMPPNAHQGEYGIAGDDRPYHEEAFNEPVYEDSQGTMAEGMSMIDNALWDGAMLGPCCANCGGGNACPPDWYTEQGVRILTRSRPRDLVIGSKFDGRELTPILTSRSAAPDVAAAYSMKLGHYFARDRLNRDHFVEFSFWGVNGWKDTSARRGDGNLYSEFAVQGFFLDGFDAAYLQSIYYASYTNNFELNGRFTPRGQPDRLVLLPNGKWQRQCQPGVFMSYLYGLRFFQENETFRFHSESISNDITNTGDYDIVTHNNLLGFQFGADMTFRKCRWHWGIRAKLSPCINFSDHQSTLNSGPANAPTVSLRGAAAKHEASLIGETGFFASYKFRPNLIGRASYDFMWVTGMALAPEQLQFTTFRLNHVNNNGTILYHGITLSMEWLW